MSLTFDRLPLPEPVRGSGSIAMLAAEAPGNRRRQVAGQRCAGRRTLIRVALMPDG
jgi:hypothetical protein